MELAWETGHDDHVSTSAGTENASFGNVFEMKGCCGVDLGLKALGCWAASVAGALKRHAFNEAQQAGSCDCHFTLCHCSCLPRVRVSLDSAGIGILHLGWCCRGFLVW